MISGIGIGIGLLSASYFLLFRREQAYGRFALGIILVLTWLCCGPALLASDTGLIKTYIASLPLMFFILLPLIYGYHQVLIAESPIALTKSHLLHLIPTISVAALSLSLALMPTTEFIALFYDDDPQLSPWGEVNAIGFGVAVAVWLLLSARYLVLMAKQSASYHRKLKQMFANHDNKQVYWFNGFLGCLVFTWLYSVIVLLVDNHLSAYYLKEEGVPVLLICLMWLFSVHALRRTPALAQIKSDLPGQQQTPYKQSSIDTDRMQRIAEKINVLVNEQSAHLEPDINAAKMAEQMGISTHYLSQTLSQHMDTTFYDFINAARIDAAKQQLKHTTNTVLDVATSVGFNTRSSFYNAFKKHTGMTPTAYRQLT